MFVTYAGRNAVESCVIQAMNSIHQHWRFKIYLMFFRVFMVKVLKLFILNEFFPRWVVNVFNRSFGHINKFYKPNS